MSDDPTSPSVLLTGATGLLGRYLLRDLLLAQRRVYVLARPSRKRSAEERIDELVRELAFEADRPLRHPICLEGTLERADLGLSSGQRDMLQADPPIVLHNAASVAFRNDSRTGEPEKTNLHGTRHLLQFFRRDRNLNFHYVSTAYVCGQRSGKVSEAEFELPSEFRNVYEATKFRAEEAVRSTLPAGQRTVYRPAVIVGEFDSGRTSVFTGPYQAIYYTWLQAQYAATDAHGRWHHPVRISLNGDEPRNFVPVDWVSAAIVRGVLTPELHGGTYHLTPETPVTTRLFETALSEYFRYDGVSFVGRRNLPDQDSTEAEREFYGSQGLYLSYLASEPYFDATNTRERLEMPCPKIDKAALLRMIDFSVKAGFGRGNRRAAAVEPAVSSTE